MENSSELDNKNEVPSINDVNINGQYSDGLNEKNILLNYLKKM